MTDTFVCDRCGGTFATSSEEEADAEAFALWGVTDAHTKVGPMDDQMAQVCDDCFELVVATLDKSAGTESIASPGDAPEMRKQRRSDYRMPVGYRPCDYYLKPPFCDRDDTRPITMKYEDDSVETFSVCYYHQEKIKEKVAEKYAPQP